MGQCWWLVGWLVSCFVVSPGILSTVNIGSPGSGYHCPPTNVGELFDAGRSDRGTKMMHIHLSIFCEKSATWDGGN